MKKDILIYILLALILAFGIYQYSSRPNIACVQLGKVYDEFEMKKQLEGKYKNISNARKVQLDSLELHLKALSNIIVSMNEKDPLRQEKINEFEYKKQDYLQKKKTFGEDNQQTSKMYEEEVWKQLNQYITDYGKEKGYTCVLGANGTGAVMYIQQSSDVTDAVITYVNNKFKGLK